MTVTVEGGRARVRFDDFGLTSYRRFLRAKTIPEKQLVFDDRSGSYELSTPERFAALLDPTLAAGATPTSTVAPHLFDYQRFIVERALEAKRYAVWADTGLGKTAMFLDFARLVRQRTSGRVLILSPGQIIEQTRGEATRFYGPGMAITRLDTREDLARWCVEGEGIAIATYHKLVDGVLNDLRHLAGLVLDESSVLKSGGGVIKWNLIKSARGIEYKLSCTATPAPNDTMEYASQASFLETLRHEGEILWTYFSRDKYGNWRVKPHAKDAFYRFMSSWSIYLRDPAHYGFGDILATLPPPVIREEQVAMTEEQRVEMHAALVGSGKGLFDRLGVRERAKLAQIARGFVYDAGQARRIPSLKPERVAERVAEHVAAGRQVLVWTVFDEESDIVIERLAAKGITPATLHGDDGEALRERAIVAFRSGAARVLVSKAQLVGYGLNFQNARAMVFSGLDYSFERMYQAVRRAYRYGQTEPVHVEVPYVAELEGMIFENVRDKERRFMEEAATCEDHYRAAMGLA